MFASDEEIIPTIIITTLMILIFAVIVIIAVLKYRDKRKELAQRELTIQNELTRANLETKEQTWKELSERIHGDIQQTLILIKLNLNRILINKSDIDVAKIEQIKELVINTITEVKGLSKDLDPKYITGHTLEENVEHQLLRVRERTELQTVFINSEDEINITKDKQVFIYRIIQESINNILAHAQATYIQIELKNNKNSFSIIIEDNGKGLEEGFHESDKRSQNKGIGLLSMQHRTTLINGEFTIESKSNKGTKIILNIPYDS